MFFCVFGNVLSQYYSQQRGVKEYYYKSCVILHNIVLSLFFFFCNIWYINIRIYKFCALPKYYII